MERYSEEVSRYAYNLWVDERTLSNRPICAYDGFYKMKIYDYYINKSIIILRDKKIRKILSRGNR